MNKLKSIAGLAAAILACSLGGAGSAWAQQGHAQHGASAAAEPHQHGEGGHDMMMNMQEMHRKMSAMKMTGDQDHDFAMMMRSHHEGGVAMARAQLEHGKDPQMKKMAKKMIADQTREIGKLDAWLAKHRASGK